MRGADCDREPVSARTEAAQSVPRRAANNPSATTYTRSRIHGGGCTNQLNAQSMPPVSLPTVFQSRNNGSICRADVVVGGRFVVLRKNARCYFFDSFFKGWMVSAHFVSAL